MHKIQTLAPNCELTNGIFYPNAGTVVNLSDADFAKLDPNALMGVVIAETGWQQWQYDNPVFTTTAYPSVRDLGVAAGTTNSVRVLQTLVNNVTIPGDTAAGTPDKLIPAAGTIVVVTQQQLAYLHANALVGGTFGYQNLQPWLINVPNNQLVLNASVADRGIATMPTVALGAAAGTSPTGPSTVFGYDQVGSFQFTEGTSPTTGTIATVTFGTALSSVSNALASTVTITDLTSGAAFTGFTTSISSTVLTITEASVLTAGHVYQVTYAVSATSYGLAMNNTGAGSGNTKQAQAGSDTSGVFSFTTAGSPATGTLATVTYGTALSGNALSVTATLFDVTAGVAVPAANVVPTFASATAFNVSIANTALTAGHKYILTFNVTAPVYTTILVP